jgi:hypothetical protein
MYTEMQLAVEKNDMEYVKNFLRSCTQGKLRRCMYAACLFDNVEVAQYCIEQGLLFEKATIASALSEGATFVADLLYDTAVERGIADILEKCDFVITNSFANRQKIIMGAKWLVQKGYIFKYHELLGLIVNDDLELFKITIRDDSKTNYEQCNIIQKCLDYKGYKILEFLQQKFHLSVENDEYESWKQKENIEREQE